MANLVITTSRHRIKFDFGVRAVNEKKTIYNKSLVSKISLESDESCVSIYNNVGACINVSYNGSAGTTQIDSVDGTAPVSNSNLFDLLSAAISYSVTPIASVTVTCATTTTVLVAGNTSRKGLVITNTGANPVFLGLGEPAVLNKGIYLAANGGMWEDNEMNLFRSAINGIASSSSSNISIQEFQ